MAKEVGFCNCMCGCENHLVKLLPGFSYVVREKNSEKMEALKPKEIEDRMAVDRLLLKEKRRRQR